ncbi:MAG: hypothetical protein Q8S18_00785 [Bacteroidales bacterium]|nr:hypothetical protein [Bacteroidales bacterium]
MQLITEYPVWMLSLNVLAGLLYAWFSYLAFPQLIFGKRLTYLLFLFRFLVITLISFLLLNPFVLALKKETEKPIVIIAHDNSSSLLFNNDSVYYRTDYLDKLDQLKSELKQKFQVNFYTFGEQLNHEGKINFSDQLTDFTPVFGQLTENHKRKNVAAMLLFSDGLYNTGVNPAFAIDGVSFPVYTIGIGDTVIRPDVFIFDVRYNKKVLNQSDFPVEVTVNATKSSGNTVNVNLFMDDQLVGKQSLAINAERFSSSLRFLIKNAPEGLHKLKVEVGGLTDESIKSNNDRMFYVDVIKKMQRVLILAASPHPDLGAFASAYKGLFETEIIFERDKPLADYKPDLLILHQLPSTSPLSVMAGELLADMPGLPVCFISGPQTNLNLFNTLQSNLKVVSPQQLQQIDAAPLFEQSFGLFTLENDLVERINKFPPLTTTFAEYQQSSSLVRLFNQRIRGVVTSAPLIAFGIQDKRKQAFIAGTGIWRWRQHDFLVNGSHQAIHTLLVKIANYLMVVADERPLRVYTANEFLIYEQIQIEAELYNESMELVNEPELNLLITNQADDTDYAFVFSRVSNTYRLNIGRLPEGVYNYQANATIDSQLRKVKGSFRVLEGSAEGSATTADHGLLNLIAEKTNGKLMYPDDLSELADNLLNNPDFKPVVKYSKAFEPLIGFYWILMIILAFLAVEWILRKLNGSY